MKIAVASNNPGKIREIKEILPFFELTTMKELCVVSNPEESGHDFLENALIKAEALYRLIKLPTLADDSGLVVEALGGAPGIYSARYAGEPSSDSGNINKLLSEMNAVVNRRAKFVSAVVLYFGPGDYLTAGGEAVGEISEAPRGKGGFGYDPVFYSYDLNKGFGEASEEDKNRVSHRGRALRKLAELWLTREGKFL